MYDYRKMSPEQREQILAKRKSRKFPWHAPPHYGGEKKVFLITGACFNHRAILTDTNRLEEFSDALIMGLRNAFGIIADTWVVQPNHYHIMAQIDLDIFRPWIGRLHNGKSTQWNREDGTPKRKVWFRFSDRHIRSEKHYFATLNYIHANPVKHGYSKKATDWPWNSIHEYLESYGRDTLAEWWRKYPIKNYGMGWDD